MFETLGLSGWTPAAAAVVFGGGLGVLFGWLAERSGFCLRRGLVGPVGERASARGVWAVALAVAVGGTSALIASGLIDVAGHRFVASRLPLVALIAGGLMFGAGMVLARGCASRHVVLAGTGNLRAIAVLLFFAATAHATLKGTLAPLRVAVGSLGVDVGGAASLAAWPGGRFLLSAAIVAALLWLVVRSGAKASHLLMGAGIGALVPLGWLGTGYVLSDPFEPIPLETLAFTSAATESLFWWVAGTAVAPTFGTGLLGGVLAGSAASALLAGRFRWVGFTSEVATSRYLVGAILMGIGGVLAGGCTVGAGMGGTSVLSVAALVALGAMIVGALGSNMLLDRTAASDDPTSAPVAVAAE